jgi:tRNA-Thr(GGU) m(6)t(6)A37 methyltransferase TsaA
MDFIFHPIGVIHSPFTEKEKTPIQVVRSQAVGQVEVFPEFADGLKDIEHLSHIHLLYVFHESTGHSLHVKPFLDDREHGIFATRYPYRPNPIGLSTVRLVSRQNNILTIEGVDVLNGTPLLDIKPYVPDFDIRMENVRAGWYETRSKK